jgi:hypothetical protein
VGVRESQSIVRVMRLHRGKVQICVSTATEYLLLFREPFLFLNLLLTSLGGSGDDVYLVFSCLRPRPRLHQQHKSIAQFRMSLHFGWRFVCLLLSCYSNQTKIATIQALTAQSLLSGCFPALLSKYLINVSVKSLPCRS